MKKGGYKIVNLQDLDLYPEDNIWGSADLYYIYYNLYDEVKNSKRKPFLLSGIVIDSVEKPDTFTDFEYVQYSDSEGPQDLMVCHVYGIYIALLWRENEQVTWVLPYKNKIVNSTGV